MEAWASTTGYEWPVRGRALKNITYLEWGALRMCQIEIGRMGFGI